MRGDVECGCEIHEEIHYELPDCPVEVIVLWACPLHEYDPRGLRQSKAHKPAEHDGFDHCVGCQATYQAKGAAEDAG